MPVLPLDCHLPTQNTTHTIKLQWTNNKRNKDYKQLMEPPTMLLVPICRDMQLWWDKPPIPSPRNRMPGDTCFDDVGRNCACVTWTQMYVTLQTKNVFHSKAVIILFYIRAPRATGAQRPSPAGSECTAIALDMGQAHLWYENNTMQTIHAIQTLRTVCDFLDMGDGCCLIFNKNQLMFIVRKSITAQIKRKIILFFS